MNSNIPSIRPLRGFLRALAILLAAFGLLAPPAARADIISHWALDETSGTTAACDVNSIYNGANTSLAINQTGKIGQAYSFNGSSSKIVPATVLPWNNVQTISAWVNRGTDASAGGRQILGWGTTTPSTAYTQYRLISGKLTYFNAGAVGGSAMSVNVVPASSWNHVVAVKNGANVQLYINGTADGSAANLSGTMPAGAPANIGYLPGIGQCFSGGIDDVAVWNTALTVGKVRSLSTITAVLGDYSASKMDKLFQVFDGTLASYVDGANTWQQASGLTGHNEGDAWTDGTTYYVQLDAAGTGVSTIPGAPVAPTKLAITAVNGGVNPIAGTTFNVVVQAQDAAGTPRNVTAATAVSLSLKTGTGTLAGTVSGTIAAGTGSVTLSGVTYSLAESGVVLTATRTGGDSLTAADSAAFTVDAAPVPPTKLAILSVNGGANPSAGSGFSVVVQAQDAGGTARNVTAATAVSLSLKTGTGTLGGTLTGTIAAGAGSVTISGVTYSKAESGVVLTATRTSGDSLTAADSAAFTVNSTPSTITLTKPTGRVVYQRTYANLVNVQVKGSYTGTAEGVEARAVTRAGFGGTTTAWTAITAAAGQFDGTLPVTGGWYDVEVRTLSGGVQSGIATVQRVGIGEVFITAGQSNAACHGSPAQTPADDRVSAYNLGTASWQLANDPQPGATGSGGSPWPHLGDLLAARYNVPIGIVCVAVGGTKVIQWQPGTTFYGYIQSAINSLAPTGGFRAILWHQGESDSNPPTGDAPNSSWDQDYATNLQNIIAQSRTDAGFTVPWGVAIASWNGTGAANYAHVTNGQHLVIDNYPGVFLGSQTDLFHSQNLPYFSDGIHFNQQGLDTHGQQWLDALVTANIIADPGIIVDAGASTVAASPAIVSNDGITPSTITVTLKELGGMPVAGRLVSLAQTSGPGTAVITTVSGMTGSAGTATFTVTSATAGAYVFTATNTTDIPNVVVSQTAAVTFSSGAVSIANSTVTSAPSSVAADGTSTFTITATLKDVAGLPVPGKTVALAQTSGPVSASLTTVSGTSDAAGHATFTVATTRAGVYGFQATTDSGGVVLTPTATVTFVASAVSAANSTVVVNTPVVAADNAATATVTVTLKDANSNPVAGQSVTLASSRGASDTVSAASGPSSAAGVVTFTVRSATPGIPVFTATAGAPGVVVAATVTVTYYAANLGTMIGHWSLDETSGTTAATEVNPLFNGTIMTGTTLNQAGKIGKAFTFNGSGKVDLGALPWFDTMTLSAWVNPGTDTSIARNIFSWGVTSPGTYYTQYRLSSGKLQYQQAGGVSGTATSAASVSTTGWTHVVAVKNGASLQLYLNGTADGSAANLAGSMPAGTSANIGYLPTYGYGFLGGIDDVAMWNTALTAGKVRALSTITAVLGTYDAGKMDKLFQVYDGALGSCNDGTRTWLKTTGLTGHSAGDAWTSGTTYYVQLDASGGGVSGGAVPYDTWANGSFAHPFTDKVAAHDPDGDGMTNQQEFAFGLDPTTGASVNPISQQLNKGTGIFKYTRTKDSGLTYIHQYSTTLSDPWLAFTPVTDPPAATGDPVEEVTVEVPAALLNANSKFFVRVQAQ